MQSFGKLMRALASDLAAVACVPKGVPMAQVMQQVNVNAEMGVKLMTAGNISLGQGTLCQSRRDLGSMHTGV